MDISSVRYEDVAFIDETVINGKTYTRLHVPIFDDSRYERANTAALIDNINQGGRGCSPYRQTHMITDDCYEETVGELNGVTVVVCFYFIPTNAVLDVNSYSYYFPSSHLDVSTDEIPPEYLTKERVKAMLDLMQERAKLLEDSAVTIEKVSDSNVIYIDERDEAYARLKSGKYNNLVRKPLNPASREYKDGKRYIAVLFRYYLHELIKDGLKACNKEIRDKIPNNTPHKGRKGIQPADYLFYMIDQVHTGKADLEYEGMMPDIVRSGYVSAQWTTTAISMYASKPDLIPFLRFLVTYSAVAFRHHEHIFAVDSTGFRCTTRGDYYGDKHHKKKENDWVDAHALVGVNSNVAIAVKSAHKYKEDELVGLE
ncbi:MAG TPA: hypothetical protein O0X42_00185, partial [Methanocorpusculum sp.]|nr:hypothetical protein [Methanocorpusculum sp.]